MECLDPGAVGVVRQVWAERLGVPAEVFEADEPVFVDRPDLTAAVVVRLGRTTVVAAPTAALSAARRLAPEQLLDVGSLLVALELLGPSLLGSASLSVVDQQAFSPVVGCPLRAATRADVEKVASACSDEERDESGLVQMTMHWVASGQAGDPVAAAGYEVWGGGLAHIGVAVAPDSRGRGLAAVTATAAVLHAISAGLVPQWRCREDNVASARVGARLGFVRVGEQVAIDLAAALHA